MPGPDGALRVLIVEDELLLALELADLVRLMGHEAVGPVATLTTGLELLQGASIDAALLDINLWGEPVYPLAQGCLDRGIPVIFVTSLQPKDIVPEMRSLPCMTKPWTRGKLEGLMSTVFRPSMPA